MPDPSFRGTPRSRHCVPAFDRARIGAVSPWSPGPIDALFEAA